MRWFDAIGSLVSGAVCGLVIGLIWAFRFWRIEDSETGESKEEKLESLRRFRRGENS